MTGFLRLAPFSGKLRLPFISRSGSRLRRLRHAFCILFIFVFSLVGLSHGWAESRVAVLYPNVQEPYLSIFQNILNGVQSELGRARVRPVAVSENIEPDALRSLLREERIDVVIALGRQGFLAAQRAGEPLPLPVVVGALPIVPGGFSGISLSPDPDLLFRQLGELAPSVKRVHVVYSEGNDWLIQRAQTSARSRGLQLSAYRVGDLREAVRQYRDLTQGNLGRSEAIWLPLDTVTSDDDVILPMLLRAAWDNKFVLFSSKPSHAQRGALFSMYPNHFALGRNLGAMASSFGNPHAELAVPLSDLHVAVNVRTAAHLGLRFTPRQQERFDLVFPSR